MRIALAGRPGSGKSTLFDLLEGNPEGHVGAGLRIAHVEVPDPRLITLSEAFEPKKTTPARLEFQDLEQKSGPLYPALSPERREMLSKVDLTLLVVELYSVGPDLWETSIQEQLGEVRDEFSLLDLATIEGRLERLGKMLKSGQAPSFPSEQETLEELLAVLNDGKPISTHPAAIEKARELRGFGFMTARPILPAFNVGEDDLGAANEQIASLDLSGLLAGEGSVPRVIFCAEVEKQIQELPPDDQESFIEAFGLEEAALPQTIRAAYSMAGLESFFTVGKDECRAWSVRVGATAPQAAGAIHTDLEKGFVRAEVVSYEDWRELGSMDKAKEKGRHRLEGKDYVIQDGDIVNIRSGLAKSKG